MIDPLESWEEGLDDDVDVIMGFEKPVGRCLKLKGAAIDEVGLFDGELRPGDVRTLGAAQQPAASKARASMRLDGKEPASTSNPMPNAEVCQVCQGFLELDSAPHVFA